MKVVGNRNTPVSRWLHESGLFSGLKAVFFYKMNYIFFRFSILER